VDFQRDVWRNDNFEILYEEEFIKYDKANKNLGKILFANLELQSLGSLKLYRFESDKGKIEYFDENGKSAKKLLMKTPIDGARLSSGFGMRKHPIRGYMKKHQGVDFAAPTGTPIYAAGDGIIEMKQRYKGYGKYIRIRHANGFKTAYGHMSKFNKTPSGRVKQGSIIGYVGSTGNSTGPHLHYEVLKNNIRINPQKLKLPSGRKLKGDELQRFIETKNLIYRKLDNLGVY
jgi:murein DD-endopeptidase MepM/ murein hydrolase activator NlpD